MPGFSVAMETPLTILLPFDTPTHTLWSGITWDYFLLLKTAWNQNGPFLPRYIMAVVRVRSMNDFKRQNSSLSNLYCCAKKHQWRGGVMCHCYLHNGDEYSMSPNVLFLVYYSDLLTLTIIHLLKNNTSSVYSHILWCGTSSSLFFLLNHSNFLLFIKVTQTCRFTQKHIANCS